MGLEIFRHLHYASTEAFVSPSLEFAAPLRLARGRPLNSALPISGTRIASSPPSEARSVGSSAFDVTVSAIARGCFSTNRGDALNKVAGSKLLFSLISGMITCGGSGFLDSRIS